MRRLELRHLQKRALNQALEIQNQVPNPSIIAHLAPRFGKTIWCLELFRSTPRRILLLPSYWLSVHTSFHNEINKIAEFRDFDWIESEEDYHQSNADKIVIPLSLCGEAKAWEAKNAWLKNIDTKDMLVVFDEGDFGSHRHNQINKIKSIFGDSNQLFRIVTSGTNIQRMSAVANKVDGLILSSYTELENSNEVDIIKRQFYQLDISDIYDECFDANKETPIWKAILDNQDVNEPFITELFRSLTGDGKFLSLNKLTGDEVRCFMFLINGTNAMMRELKKIVASAVPDYKVVSLNGDEQVTNKAAESIVKAEIAKAKKQNLKGVIIISNQMGSRSFSVSEIQATIIAYDKGGSDTLIQKTSRCLTPGATFLGDSKKYGHIIDLSFDPRRTENIEKIIIEDAALMSQINGTSFSSTVKSMADTIDLLQSDSYGKIKRVDENSLFIMLSDKEQLIKVADVSIDKNDILDADIVNIIGKVKIGGRPTIRAQQRQKPKGNGNGAATPASLPSNIKNIQMMVNNAIKTINRSTTTIVNLSEGGCGIRETLLNITGDNATEYHDLLGIEVSDTLMLLDRKVLNEVILDLLVENSRKGHIKDYVTNKDKGLLGKADNESLWSDIISNIPDEVLLKPDLKILNVACGYGTEARVLVNRMVALGKSKEEAMASIWLNDLHISICKPLIEEGFTNVIQQDFLEWESDMKFDVVVGNPPYKGFACLHQKFFNRGVEKLKDGGHIVFIQPATPFFNHKDSAREHEKLMRKNIKENKVAAYFKDFSVFDGNANGETLLVITYLVKEKTEHEVDYIKYSNGYEYRNITLDSVNQLAINPHIFITLRNKYNNYIRNHGSLGDVCGKTLIDDVGSITIPSITGSIDEDRYFSIITNDMCGFIDRIKKRGKDEYRSLMIDQDKKESFFSFAKTFVARFGLVFIKINQLNSRGELKGVPLVPFDRLWTDEELAQLIGLTDEELEVIIKSLPDYHNLLKDVS